MTIIITQRLIIRPFKDKDAAALLDYLSSPRAPCFNDEKLHSIAEAEKEVARRASEPGQFAVCLKETDELIGALLNKSELADRMTCSDTPVMRSEHCAAFPTASSGLAL